MIGLVVFQVMFQVLRIHVSFNLLLGRPWIHSAGVIPSSFHLKVKFIHDWASRFSSYVSGFEDPCIL